MVVAGIDHLRNQGFTPLRGARLGIITNHTGRAADGTSTLSVLLQSGTVEVKALFTPEHGLQGQVGAGESVASGTDSETGLPIYSLYGDTRRPNESMLQGLDTLIFDIQDVGARFYTYSTTMAYCLEACATRDLKFVALDRPNPINGVAIEGPVVEDSFRSFIGYLQVPIRHGMTIGELAHFHKAAANLNVNLQVIRAEGWRRDMWFDQTGLIWDPPSPAMLSLNTATLYPGTCILEGTNASEGRGTENPFELTGAPWIDGNALSDDLNERALPGVKIEPVEFAPTQREYADQVCYGVRFVITDRNALNAVELGLHVLDAIHRQNPVEFQFARITRHVGNARIVQQLESFAPVQEIIEEWREAASLFEKDREGYLLYD